MIKPDDPRQLALDILERSVCHIKVGAAISDKTGILSWGWNSVGFDGFGEHAEASAIRRANKKRLAGSTIYVAGRRQKPIFSRPCYDCEQLIKRWGITKVVYTDGNIDGWREEDYGM